MASVCDPHQVLLAQVKLAEKHLKQRPDGADKQAQLRQLLVLRMRIQGMRDEQQARLDQVRAKQQQAREEYSGLSEELDKRKQLGYGYASQESTCGDSDGESDDDFDCCSVMTEDEMSPAYFRAGQCVLTVEDRPLFRRLPAAHAKGIEVDVPVAPCAFRGGLAPPAPKAEPHVKPVTYLPPPSATPERSPARTPERSPELPVLVPSTPSPTWASLRPRELLELPRPAEGFTALSAWLEE